MIDLSKKKNNKKEYRTIIDVDSCSRFFECNTNNIALLRDVVALIEDILNSLDLSYEIFANWEVLSNDISSQKKHKA